MHTLYICGFSISFYKDLKLINNDLTAQGVIEVLSSDDPSVSDGEGCYNLELEVSIYYCYNLGLKRGVGGGGGRGLWTPPEKPQKYRVS